jgi:phage tail protein X
MLTETTVKNANRNTIHCSINYDTVDILNYRYYDTVAIISK